MRLEFTYTSNDFMEMHTVATRESLKTRRPNTSFGKLLDWTVFVGLSVALFMVMQPPKTAPPPGAAPVPVPATSNSLLSWVMPMLPAALMLGVFWFYFIRQFRAARRGWESNPVTQQPKTMDLTEASVRLSDALLSTEWRWEAFIKLVETKTLLLLKQGDGTFVMIPKRAAPPGELDALRLLLNERVGLPGAFPVLPPKPPSVSA
ncbi:MAG: YcxB family protein [Tepidisphaeraceae bacterium]